MPNSQTFQQVDQSAIKVSQALTSLLLLAAFGLDSWPLTALVGGATLLGAAVPGLSLFSQLYRRLLKPAGSTWHNFSSEAGNFSLRFPAEPVERVNQAGDTTVHIFIAEVGAVA